MKRFLRHACCLQDKPGLKNLKTKRPGTFILRSIPGLNGKAFLQATQIFHRLRNGNESQQAFGDVAQLGVYFIPKTLEMALRQSYVYQSAEQNQQEYGAALNYYIWGHHLKIQADYAWLYDASVSPEWSQRFIVQTQMNF